MPLRVTPALVRPQVLNPRTLYSGRCWTGQPNMMPLLPVSTSSGMRPWLCASTSARTLC